MLHIATNQQKLEAIQKLLSAVVMLNANNPKFLGKDLLWSAFDIAHDGAAQLMGKLASLETNVKKAEWVNRGEALGEFGKGRKKKVG